MAVLRDSLFWLQAMIVAVVWLLVALAIRRWGPGCRKRSVYCPETSARAKVAVLEKEGDWGALRAADITACSLFPGAAVTCDKKCLARL